MKNKIKKHIRKYMTIFCSLLLIPIFSVNAFAYTSYDNIPLSLDIELTFYKTDSSYVQYSDISVNSSDYTYNIGNAAQSSVNQCSVFLEFPWVIPVNITAFDYYFVASVYGRASDVSNFSYYPTSCSLWTRNHDGDLERLTTTENEIYHLDSYRSFGFAISCKIDFLDYSNIDYIRFYSSSGGGTIPANLVYQSSVIALPKDSTADVVSSAIVNAIDNQTSILGGKLDGIDDGIQQGNDLIENGNSGTQSAVTDFNDVFEDFNNELAKVEEFDTEILDEFNAANETYLTELNNFELSGSLLNAGNWLSTSMQTVYDNSSDYKMLWLVPLLLGIPLIILFIKRGDNNE